MGLGGSSLFFQIVDKQLRPPKRISGSNIHIFRVITIRIVFSFQVGKISFVKQYNHTYHCIMQRSKNTVNTGKNTNSSYYCLFLTDMGGFELVEFSRLTACRAA